MKFSEIFKNLARSENNYVNKCKTLKR